MATKAEIAQQLFNEMVSFGCSKEEIIAEFQSNPLMMMTSSGATTYYYNCKRASSGGKFNTAPTGEGHSGRSRDVPFDNSPDVEDQRPLFTLVTPGDSECGKFCVVKETHSWYDRATPLSKAKYDQFVVEGLPEIGDNVDNLTPIAP